MRQLIFSLVTLIVLCSCAEPQPHVYKVVLPKWEKMSHHQRQTVIADADTRDFNRYKGEPVINIKTPRSFLTQHTNPSPIVVSGVIGDDAP